MGAKRKKEVSETRKAIVRLGRGKGHLAGCDVLERILNGEPIARLARDLKTTATEIYLCLERGGFLWQMGVYVGYGQGPTNGRRSQQIRLRKVWDKLGFKLRPDECDQLGYR